MPLKGSGNKEVSRMESAGGNRAFHRGKQGIACFTGMHLFILLSYSSKS